MKKIIWQELLKYHFCLDDFFPHMSMESTFFSSHYIFLSLCLFCVFFTLDSRGLNSEYFFLTRLPLD